MPEKHLCFNTLIKSLVISLLATLVLIVAYALWNARANQRRAFEEWSTVCGLAENGRYREVWERMHPDFQTETSYDDFQSGFTNNPFQTMVFGNPLFTIPSLFKSAKGGRQLRFILSNSRLWIPRWVPEDFDFEKDGAITPEITMEKDGDTWKCRKWMLHCR